MLCESGAGTELLYTRRNERECEYEQDVAGFLSIQDVNRNLFPVKAFLKLVFLQ